MSKIVRICLFNVVPVLGFCLLAYFSLSDSNAATRAFVSTAYYLTAIMFAIWLFQIQRCLSSVEFSVSHFLRRYWPGLIVALLLSSLVFTSVAVKFKTLSDETNLLSVSKSVLERKNCTNITEGRFYYNKFRPISPDTVPGKPLAHPFLLYLIHTLTGYRYQNGFVLNFILLWSLLTGAYVVVRSRSDFCTALAGMFLILSFPVVTIFATTSGYDFLNCLLFYMIMILTFSFIREPSSSKFGLIIISLLIFTNTRYESGYLLFLLPLLLVRKIKWKFVADNSFLLCMTPLLSLPYIWQKYVHVRTWQKTTNPVLSTSSFLEHAKTFLVQFARFDNDLPYANILNIAAVVVCLLLVLQILTRRIRLKRYQFYWLLVFSISLCAHMVIMFSSFFGRYDHPVSVRYFLIFSVFCAIAPMSLPILYPRVMKSGYLLCISIGIFLFYHPIAVRENMINRQILVRTTEHCVDFLNKEGEKNTLVISARPGQYVALGYGAVSFAYANRHQQNLLREIGKHLFSKVFVFQEIDYGTGGAIDKNKLAPAYKLKALYEIQITAEDFLRISEVEQPVNGFGSR